MNSAVNLQTYIYICINNQQTSQLDSLKYPTYRFGDKVYVMDFIGYE